MGLAREHLRRATADMHEALHAAAPFAQIAQGDIDRADYGALLRLLHRYHLGMAGGCAAGAAALDLPELAASHRARIARLQDDLAFVNVPPAAVVCEPARDGAFSVGCLYTVLGSTLGGKVISRQLESLLPGGRGRSFFTGSSTDGADWRLYCIRLEERAYPLARLEAGARHGFGCFAALMEDWRVRRPACAR